jgi:hypothetical protein
MKQKENEKPALDPDRQSKIAGILEAFKNFDGVYKREQVDAAIELQEEITQALIEILENALAEPEKFTEDNDRYDHIYALMLLGHFRETRAHRVIIDLCSLPGGLPHELFGDLTTEDLPTILLRTCGGSIDLIRSLASNRDTDDFCRVSALNAMAYAVVENIVSRGEVLAFYGTLFNPDEADEYSDFWGLLANCVCDLYPEEMMDTIDKAYEEDLINPGVIRYEAFESALEDGREKCLERLKIDLEHRSLDDIHASMSWWACFNQELQQAQEISHIDNPAFSDIFNQPATKIKKKRKKNRAAKKKRNQAKAARRKNRR